MANELSTQVQEVQLPALFEPGKLVQDRYQLLHLIGSGGVCFVLAARHAGFDELVALKFLQPEFADNAEAVRRFTLEARTCFKLRSEHIVRVFDVGMYEGVPFLAMELLQGTDLRGFLNKQTDYMPIARAVDFMLQVCDALSVAHGIGIIHRDIKPENLFIVGDADADLIVKVLDFGISKVALVEGLPDLRITQRFTQVAVGTPPYMSPEQVRSAGDLDARADLWSVGCVLYELVTGMSPFSRGSVIQSCAAVLEYDPIPPHELRPSVPLELSAVIMRCLQKAPVDRYEDVGQLAMALSSFGTGRYVAYAERCRVNLMSADPALRRATPQPYRASAEHGDYLTGSKMRQPLPPRQSASPRNFQVTGSFQGTGSEAAWRHGNTANSSAPAAELGRSSVMLVPEHERFDAAHGGAQAHDYWKWALAGLGVLAIGVAVGMWLTAREPEPLLTSLPQAAEQKPAADALRDAPVPQVLQVSRASQPSAAAGKPRANEEPSAREPADDTTLEDEGAKPTRIGPTRRQAVTARQAGQAVQTAQTADDDAATSQPGTGTEKLKVKSNREAESPEAPAAEPETKSNDVLDIGF